MLLLRNKQLALLLVFLVASSECQFRFLNGEDTNIEKYPYVVSFRHSTKHICNAAILNQITLITSATCGSMLRPKNLSNGKIKAGSSDLGKGGVVVDIESIKLHPDYDKSNNDNDIALVFLKSPLVFSDKINKIQLPIENKDKVTVGMKGTVVGFGQKGLGEDIGKQLNKKDVTVTDKTKCQKEFRFTGAKLPESLFCVGGTSDGDDPCFGDPGAPLVLNGKLYGIATFLSDDDCGVLPGLYVDVTKLISFVTKNARDTTGA